MGSTLCSTTYLNQTMLGRTIVSSAAQTGRLSSTSTAAVTRQAPILARRIGGRRFASSSSNAGATQEAGPNGFLVASGLMGGVVVAGYLIGRGVERPSAASLSTPARDEPELAKTIKKKAKKAASDVQKVASDATPKKVSQKAGEAVETVKEKVHGAKETVGEKVEQEKDGGKVQEAKQTAEQAKRTVKSSAEEATEKVKGTAEGAKETAGSKVKDAKQTVEGKAREAKQTVDDKTSPTSSGTAANASVADPISTQPAHDGEEQEDPSQAAFNPETGEINWDCPCLGGMAHGVCGEEFKEAFSCFVYSQEEPKGGECIDKFRGMQECFRAHPEVYGEVIEDDAESNEQGATADGDASEYDIISAVEAALDGPDDGKKQ